MLAGSGALAALVAVLVTRGSSESPRVASGTASPAEGPALLANGSATPAEGSASHADTSHSNGAATLGDGSASKTTGTMTPATGAASQSNGAASQPNGAASQSNVGVSQTDRALQTSGAASQTTRTASQNKRSPSATAETKAAKKPDRHRIAAAGAQPGGLAVEVSAAQQSTGFFSIDARPYADIFVDGKPFGQTPLLHKQLAVGVHHLKAVRADGKAKTYDVTIRANATAAPIIVTW